MERKIFLQKNFPKRNRAYLKVLLGSGVALVFLVIAAAYFTSPKVKEAPGARKPTAEKGAVVKEIPRPPEPEGGSSVAKDSAGTASKGMTGDARAPELPGPGPAGTKETFSAGSRVGEPTGPGMQKPAPGPAPEPKEAAPGLPQSLRDLAGSPKPPEAPKAQTAPQGPSGFVSDQKERIVAVPQTAAPKEDRLGSSKPKPPASSLGPAGSGEKPAATGKQLYSVQVGSFKDKKSAEEVRNALQKRGYETVLKPSSDPKLGQVFVVQLKPVDNLSKASTMLEQVKIEKKVTPTIVKVGSGE